ncbi:hypothetical protein EYF80_054204 [Liparis tanakae]|uniref:Uncharacterized protein n=1 Tax=Liparis tanakae TaxID=230148 RepID=A0A4Z2F4K5_9TELE|nr:hypothetical protein EYF80_054204 [Liparis tanakae]
MMTRRQRYCVGRGAFGKREEEAADRHSGFTDQGMVNSIFTLNSAHGEEEGDMSRKRGDVVHMIFRAIKEASSSDLSFIRTHSI